MKSLVLYLRMPFTEVSLLVFFLVCILIKLLDFLRLVGFPVEIEEEKPVKKPIEHQYEAHKLREATARVDERNEGVEEDDHELDHLHRGQIFLPPKVFLNLWTASRKEVVSVHADMHQSVPHSPEGRVSATGVLCPKPCEEGQTAVVNNMEGREVVKLLAKEEEE